MDLPTEFKSAGHTALATPPTNQEGMAAYSSEFVKIQSAHLISLCVWGVETGDPRRSPPPGWTKCSLVSNCFWSLFVGGTTLLQIQWWQKWSKGLKIDWLMQYFIYLMFCRKHVGFIYLQIPTPDEIWEFDSRSQWFFGMLLEMHSIQLSVFHTANSLLQIWTCLPGKLASFWALSPLH